MLNSLLEEGSIAVVEMNACIAGLISLTNCARNAHHQMKEIIASTQRKILKFESGLGVTPNAYAHNIAGNGRIGPLGSKHDEVFFRKFPTL